MTVEEILNYYNDEYVNYVDSYNIYYHLSIPGDFQQAGSYLATACITYLRDRNEGNYQPIPGLARRFMRVIRAIRVSQQSPDIKEYDRIATNFCDMLGSLPHAYGIYLAQNNNG